MAVENGASSEKPEHPEKKNYSLKDDWTFYFDGGNFTAKTTKSYLEQMHTLGEFNTIADFWRYHNSIIASVSKRREADLKEKRETKFNLRMFKTAIKPLWEAKANKEGGKWAIGGHDAEKIAAAWQHLLLGAIGCDSRMPEDLCGLVLSAKKNRMDIQIWVGKQPSNPDTIKTGLWEITDKKFQLSEFIFVSHKDSSKRAKSPENSPMSCGRRKRGSTPRGSPQLVPARRASASPSSPIPRASPSRTCSTRSLSAWSRSTPTSPRSSPHGPGGRHSRANSALLPPSALSPNGSPRTPLGGMVNHTKSSSPAPEMEMLPAAALAVPSASPSPASSTPASSTPASSTPASSTPLHIPESATEGAAGTTIAPSSASSEPAAPVPPEPPGSPVIALAKTSDSTIVLAPVTEEAPHMNGEEEIKEAVTSVSKVEATSPGGTVSEATVANGTEPKVEEEKVTETSVEEQRPPLTDAELEELVLPPPKFQRRITANLNELAKIIELIEPPIPEDDPKNPKTMNVSRAVCGRVDGKCIIC